MAFDIDDLNRFVAARLAGGLPAFRALAPEGTAYPMIVFQLMAGSNDRVLSLAASRSAVVYMIRVMGRPENRRAVRTEAGRIDGLFNGAQATFAGLSISMTRQAPMDDTETRDGITYDRMGGLYRLSYSTA